MYNNFKLILKEYVKIHQINGFIQSMYLVESEEGLLLLDSGTRYDVKVVTDFIQKKLKRNVSDLKLVIVTHAHPDHSGGAAFFQKMGIKIAAPYNLNNWYKGLSGLCTYWVDILLTYLVATRKRGKKNIFENIIFPRKIKIDYSLRDQDLIPGFEKWSVIKASGHTSLDISIYLKECATAYVADNIIVSKNKVFSPYPLFEPESYKKTIQKYIDLGIKHFLMAHYGKMSIEKNELKTLISKVSVKSRSHRNSLYKIMIKLLKSIFRL